MVLVSNPPSAGSASSHDAEKPSIDQEVKVNAPDDFSDINERDLLWKIDLWLIPWVRFLLSKWRQAVWRVFSVSRTTLMPTSFSSNVFYSVSLLYLLSFLDRTSIVSIYFSYPTCLPTHIFRETLEYDHISAVSLSMSPDVLSSSFIIWKRTFI